MNGLTPDRIRLLTVTARICARYNASVTSWIRTPKRNAMVGGSPTSSHLEGLAVDVAPDDPRDIPRIAAEFRRAKFHAVEYRTHVHAAADTMT